MEGFALGYLPIDTPTKEEKESLDLEALKKIMDKDLFGADRSAGLMMIFGGVDHPDRDSEYWSGKYEALKELYQRGEK